MDDDDQLREVAVSSGSAAAQSRTPQQSSQTVCPLLTTSFEPKRSASPVPAARSAHALSSFKSSQPGAAGSKTKESKCSETMQPQQIQMQPLVDFSVNGFKCTEEEKSQSKNLTGLFIVKSWTTSLSQFLLFCFIFFPKIEFYPYLSQPTFRVLKILSTQGLLSKCLKTAVWYQLHFLILCVRCKSICWQMLFQVYYTSIIICESLNDVLWSETAFIKGFRQSLWSTLAQKKL